MLTKKRFPDLRRWGRGGPWPPRALQAQDAKGVAERNSAAKLTKAVCQGEMVVFKDEAQQIARANGFAPSTRGW